MEIERVIFDNTEYDKRLQRLPKKDLIHLIHWGFTRKTTLDALNNIRCIECKIILNKLTE